MAIIHLVRHGEAASGWDGDLDPGLSDLGRRQAEEVASTLGGRHPVPIVSSPLRRTRETAAALAARWSAEVALDPGVGEIVAPMEASGLDARSAWLRQAMGGLWSELGPEHHAWREMVLERLRIMSVDTVVFTHFVAINVAVGAATGDDRVVVFAPANGSMTRLRNDDGVLSLDAQGDEGESHVL
jgi:broad specificity phosphatase PhoE